MKNIKNIEDILEQLKVIVGVNNFIDDVLKMDAYLRDWRDQFQGLSPLILKSSGCAKVSEILLTNDIHIYNLFLLMRLIMYLSG